MLAAEIHPRYLLLQGSVVDLISRPRMAAKAPEMAVPVDATECHSVSSAQDVLLTYRIHGYRADDVMFGETLAVDLDHQNFNFLPAPLLQLLELFYAITCRLIALRDTPTVAAICGNTSCMTSCSTHADFCARARITLLSKPREAR